MQARLAAGLAAVLAMPALAEEPLSAIDWLSDSVVTQPGLFTFAAPPLPLNDALIDVTGLQAGAVYLYR